MLKLPAFFFSFFRISIRSTQSMDRSRLFSFGLHAEQRPRTWNADLMQQLPESRSPIKVEPCSLWNQVDTIADYGYDDLPFTTPLALAADDDDPPALAASDDDFYEDGFYEDGSYEEAPGEMLEGPDDAPRDSQPRRLGHDRLLPDDEGPFGEIRSNYSHVPPDAPCNKPPEDDKVAIEWVAFGSNADVNIIVTSKGSTKPSSFPHTEYENIEWGHWLWQRQDTKWSTDHWQEIFIWPYDSMWHYPRSPSGLLVPRGMWSPSIDGPLKDDGMPSWYFIPESPGTRFEFCDYDFKGNRHVKKETRDKGINKKSFNGNSETLKEKAWPKGTFALSSSQSSSGSCCRRPRWKVGALKPKKAINRRRYTKSKP